MRGCLAGALGGLIGSAAMGRFYSAFQTGNSPPSGQEDATVLAASALYRAAFHRDLSPQQKEIAGPLVDRAFAATLGAAYGATVEVMPFLQGGHGVPFGAIAWLGAHVIAVPALGLSKPITQSDARSETLEFGAHLVYGFVTETIRRLLRVRRLAH